jgi:hypothetical protein
MLIGTTALAQSSDDTDPNRPKKLLLRYGMSASVGGGIVGFTDGDTTDFADVGGRWEARLAIGTRTPIGFEAAYTGGAQAIDALGLDTSAVLVGSGLEGLARLNLATRAWQPYVLAGAGWRRYDLTNADFNTSSVNDQDNVLEIPLGAGVAYRYKGLVVDLRAVFRAAIDSDLVKTPEGANNADLHTWETSVRAGFEF